MGKNKTEYIDAAERIYHEWDKALAQNDIDALLELYAEDAILESPLIPYLLDREIGICQGRAEIRELVKKVAERKPNLRKHYRTPCLKLDNLIMWEYPRQTSQGEQMDFAEIMNINAEGLIQSHRVYWGWRGVKVLNDDAYRR
ncbi:nuclear transport factor 2 family protein [Candidatus Dependentiae bacterium]|nr:nuclear transport factor 2 family protein [Candidatus Dependentiae bacterium]